MQKMIDVEFEYQITVRVGCSIPVDDEGYAEIETYENELKDAINGTCNGNARVRSIEYVDTEVVA